MAGLWKFSPESRRLMLENRVEKAGFSLKALAEECDIQPRQLHRWCRELFGLSAREWIDQKKMLHARRLLIEKDGNIAQVAKELGYTHPTNFTRKFKQAWGQTPREFIQQTAVHL